MLIKQSIKALAKELGIVLLQAKIRCAVAESCTGGLLAAAITDVAGSSQWFDRGFVTYTDQSKEDMLGVSGRVISLEGAVSEATVRAMAYGAIHQSDAAVSISVSGIAGPDGGTHEKPVGMVWVAWGINKDLIDAECYFFKGDRTEVRQQSVQVALNGLIKRCSLLSSHEF
jgi:nicotinamide-nucleotide amidase